MRWGGTAGAEPVPVVKKAAALRAGSDAAEPQVRALVRQARDEVDIASTALARLRSVSQTH